ncbi:MAG: hypothetical protein PHT40_02470 [Patescibacteria group bacterium]|nr:hypothetical protein [Patescibacteria group bacterium]
MSEKKDRISLPGLAKIIQKLKDGATPNHCRLGWLLGQRIGDIVIIRDVIIPKKQKTSILSAEISPDILASVAMDLWKKDKKNILKEGTFPIVGMVFFQPQFRANESACNAASRRDFAEFGCPNLGLVIGKNDEVEIIRDSSLSLIIKA